MADLDRFRAALAWLASQDAEEAAYLSERLMCWVGAGGEVERHLFADRRPGERLPEHQLASEAKDRLLADAYLRLRATGTTSGQFIRRLHRFRDEVWETPPRATAVIYPDPIDALLSDALDAAARCGDRLPGDRKALHKLLARAERRLSSTTIATPQAA